MKRDFKGFTLAEVLITLGIIGAVAALTMPSIIQKQKEKEATAKLKKIYSTLQQAYTSAVYDYGDPTNWGLAEAISITTPGETPDSEDIVNYDATGAINLSNIFSKYLKVQKYCKTEKGCFNNGKVYALNGTVFSEQSIDHRKSVSKLQLQDGTLLAFAGLDENCNNNRGDSKDLKHVCAWIITDINGSKKPNTYGIDIFEFLISKYNVLPYGTKDDKAFPFNSNCQNKLNANGNGCTAWVIYNENLDYLHCGDLSWNGKTKCK